MKTNISRRTFIRYCTSGTVALGMGQIGCGGGSGDEDGTGSGSIDEDGIGSGGIGEGGTGSGSGDADGSGSDGSGEDDLSGSISPLTNDESIILGRPTDSTISISAITDSDSDIYFEYGTEPGIYTDSTATYETTKGVPLDIELINLIPNTRYYYRMRSRALKDYDSGDTLFLEREECSFMTQRDKGSTFTFAIIADDHLPQYWPSQNHAIELYERSISNINRDNPDFVFNLGDTFWGQDAADEEDVYYCHEYQRPYIGGYAKSAPLFIVLGNHEGEQGWQLNSTGRNKAVWSTLARKYYYLNPEPNDFYSGSTTVEDFVGLRQNYYSFEWGDALFIAIDPYWYTTRNPMASKNNWDWTIGDEQYKWLKKTLEESNAKFKFIFCHNMTTGTNNYACGGIEFVDYDIAGNGSFEWGGQNEDGSWGLSSKRPTWDKPIHQLMVDNNVSALFHGHDHVFFHQELDGIVYQECPKPSDPSYSEGFVERSEYKYGHQENASGYIRVTVSEYEVNVEYVRSYREEDESSARINGEVVYSYKIK